MIVSEQLNRKKLPTLRLRVGDQSLLLFLVLAFRFIATVFPFHSWQLRRLLMKKYYGRLLIYFEEN